MRKWHWVRIYLLTTGCYLLLLKLTMVWGLLFIIMYILSLNISTYTKWHCRWIPFLHGFEFSYLNQGRWDDRWYLILLVQLSCMLFLRYVVDQTCCATWFWFLFVCYWDNSDSQVTWMNRVFFFVSSRMGQFSHLRWHSLWGTVRLSGRVWIIVCVFIMNRVGCDLVLRWNGWIICMLFIVAWGLIVV